MVHFTCLSDFKNVCVCLFFMSNWYVTPPGERRNIWVKISWDQCFLPHPCCFEHDSLLHVFTISEGTVILLCASCDLKYMSIQKWNIYFLNKGDNSLKLDIGLVLPGGGLCSSGTTRRCCLSVGVFPLAGQCPSGPQSLGLCPPCPSFPTVNHSQ